MAGPGWRIGSRFGPYELRSLLGKGGMGEVYEAFDTVKNRVVALKLLAEELAKDPVYQVRFRRESQAAARLAEPHIIPIHDWGVIDGVLFIDMRLVPGVDLREILRGQGPMSAERAVGIIEQIAAGLDAAHTDGLVHRDVKPANILVNEADFAYLADFGIANTEGDSSVTQVGQAIGSYTYMAPERFDDGPVTGRADTYSLACVLHECLTGTTPFPVASMSVLIRAHRSEPPPRPSVQRPGIPAAMDGVIARGMAKAAADRFPTTGDLALAARAALTAAPAPSLPTIIVRAPDPARRGLGDTASPESTGEISAVIRPTGPTTVSPTEIQFSPLPPQQPAAPVFGPPSAQYAPTPPIRPFPDAHLYSESPAPETRQYPQAHVEPDRYAEPDRYPESDGYSEPGQYSEPQAYSESPRYPEVSQAPPTHRYPEKSYPEQQYPEPQQFADPQQYVATQHGRIPEDHQVPPFPPRNNYPSPAYSPYGPYAEPEREDEYEDDPYRSPQRGRSVLMPLLGAVLAIVVVAVGGVIGWQVLGADPAPSASDTRQGGGVTTSARATTGNSTGQPTATTSAAPTTVTLPVGANPCTTGQPVSGAFTQSATGTTVTSCGFAEAVREAYTASATANVSRAPRSVIAISPVTGRSYTMNCVADSQLVTCTGGDNAVVYVY